MHSFAMAEQPASQLKKTIKKKKVKMLEEKTNVNPLTPPSQEELFQWVNEIHVRPVVPIEPKELLQFAGKDFDIIISLPNGVKCTVNEIPDVLYAAGTVGMIQKIENDLQRYHGKSIGKVNIIVVGSLCRYDYFLKFSEEIDKLLPSIIEKNGAQIAEIFKQHEPEKLFAIFLSECLKDAALQKEKEYIKYYQTVLDLMDVNLNIHFIGFHAIETQNIYLEKEAFIQHNFPPSSSYQQTIKQNGTQFIEQKGNTKSTNLKIYDKNFPASESKLYKVISQLEKYLKINWVKTLVAGSELYSTKEGPAFLARKGIAIYGKSIMNNIFADLFALNLGYRFMQIKGAQKKPEIVGSSPTYFKRNNQVIITPNKTKQGKKKINSSTTNVFNLLQFQHSPVENISCIYPLTENKIDEELLDGKYLDSRFFKNNPWHQLENILKSNQYYLNSYYNNLMPTSEIMQSLLMNNLAMQYRLEQLKRATQVTLEPLSQTCKLR